ncbi:MAG: PH domain-containing protein [Roseburia sp.]|nr:PH domain-containing protein [Roseburia sp.]
MNYVEKNMRSGEELVVKARISVLYLLPSILLLIALVIVAIVLRTTVFSEKIAEATAAEAVLGEKVNDDPRPLMYVIWAAVGVIGGIPFIKCLLTMLTSHLAVTNKRVVGKIGILRIDTLDIPIDKIDSVTFSAGILGNIFKYATVQIQSPGSNGWKFPGICNAQAFKDCATDAIEKHAEQARKDQAAQIASAMGNRG